MSHELSFTNGRADFVELTDGVLTAWHKEGISLPSNTPFAEALAAGNLLYPVEKQPVFVRKFWPDEYRKANNLVSPDYYVPSETGSVIVRPDRGIELGVVGVDYTVIQNSEAFAMIQPLVDEGTLRLETGGVLREGADAWVLCQINRAAFPAEVQELLNAAGIGKYILVRTNHTGRANASVTETDVRVVCANTLGMVEDGDFRQQASVQHRGNAKERLELGLSMVLKGIIKRTQDYLTAYQALASKQLTEAQWQRNVMDVVQRNPAERGDFDAKSPQATATLKRYEEKRETLHQLWTSGKGHQGDHSAWEAYNGVVEAVDHDSDVFPCRSSRIRQMLVGGRLWAIKDNVFQSLIRSESEGA